MIGFPTTYSYVNNHQGDIVGMVDSTGELVVEYWYDPWGQPFWQYTLETAYDTLLK